METSHENGGFLSRSKSWDRGHINLRKLRKDKEDKTMIKRLFKIKRYFHVSYIGEGASGLFYGCINIEVEDGKYMNRFSAINNIEKYTSAMKSCVINSIVEISKNDYKNWTQL